MLQEGFRPIGPSETVPGDVIVWQENTPRTFGPPRFDAEHSATILKPVILPDGSLDTTETIIRDKPGYYRDARTRSLSDALAQYPESDNTKLRYYHPNADNC